MTRKRDPLDQLLSARMRTMQRERRLGNARAECACGENDVTTLHRRGDTVRCRRCAAEARTSADARPTRPLFERQCIACSFVSERGAGIELHHVLGRAHHATGVLPLCRNCHALVSDAQLRYDVNLNLQSHKLARMVYGLQSLAVLSGISIARRQTPSGRALALTVIALHGVVALHEVNNVDS